jgi:hypothetical protein
MRRLNSRAAFDNLRAAQDFIYAELSLYSMHARIALHHHRNRNEHSGVG